MNSNVVAVPPQTKRKVCLFILQVSSGFAGIFLFFQSSSGIIRWGVTSHPNGLPLYCPFLLQVNFILCLSLSLRAKKSFL